MAHNDADIINVATRWVYCAICEGAAIPDIDAGEHKATPTHGLGPIISPRPCTSSDAIQIVLNSGGMPALEATDVWHQFFLHRFSSLNGWAHFECVQFLFPKKLFYTNSHKIRPFRFLYPFWIFCSWCPGQAQNWMSLKRNFATLMIINHFVLDIVFSVNIHKYTFFCKITKHKYIIQKPYNSLSPPFAKLTI